MPKIKEVNWLMKKTVGKEPKEKKKNVEMTAVNRRIRIDKWEKDGPTGRRMMNG